MLDIMRNATELEAVRLAATLSSEPQNDTAKELFLCLKRRLGLIEETESESSKSDSAGEKPIYHNMIYIIVGPICVLLIVIVIVALCIIIRKKGKKQKAPPKPKKGSAEKKGS
ncbi:hypothetical protein COOONC_05454 [Cooperia oncophora]